MHPLTKKRYISKLSRQEKEQAPKTLPRSRNIRWGTSFKMERFKNLGTHRHDTFFLTFGGRGVGGHQTSEFKQFLPAPKHYYNFQGSRKSCLHSLAQLKAPKLEQVPRTCGLMRPISIANHRMIFLIDSNICSVREAIRSTPRHY